MLSPAPFLLRPQCPGGAFTPDIKTTKEFPDDVVTFVRNHPVMFNPIYPVGRRPLVVRTNADYRYTAVAVDQVAAADGNYQVLFLGTGGSTEVSSGRYAAVSIRRRPAGQDPAGFQTLQGRPGNTCPIFHSGRSSERQLRG